VFKQLFETTLPVVSQDRDIRQDAVEQGFIAVLVRAAGSSDEPSNIDITTAARYVQKYYFVAGTNNQGKP